VSWRQYYITKVETKKLPEGSFGVGASIDLASSITTNIEYQIWRHLSIQLIHTRKQKST
jgi:hypothetical protein